VVPPASRPISRVGRYSGTPLRAALLSATGLSPSSGPRSRGLRLAPPHASVGPTTPPPQGGRFGLGPVRSPLLRASRLISLPLGTEMFQFPRFAPSAMPTVTVVPHRRVSPFGHPGLIACVPLPLAYRSLPRPSSPLCAQASSTCYRSLDYKRIDVAPGRPGAFAASRSMYPSRARAHSSPEPCLPLLHE
jgi:hypothetical protein